MIDGNRYLMRLPAVSIEGLGKISQCILFQMLDIVKFSDSVYLGVEYEWGATGLSHFANWTSLVRVRDTLCELVLHEGKHCLHNGRLTVDLHYSFFRLFPFSREGFSHNWGLGGKNDLVDLESVGVNLDDGVREFWVVE